MTVDAGNEFSPVILIGLLIFQPCARHPMRCFVGPCDRGSAVPGRDGSARFAIVRRDMLAPELQMPDIAGPAAIPL